MKSIHDLISQDPNVSADFGIYMGYGYNSKEEAMDTIDTENPPLGFIFKICGANYMLCFSNKFYFREVK